MSEKFSILSKNGMVASSLPLATLAGVEALMNGGNAINAAVATAAVSVNDLFSPKRVETLRERIRMDRGNDRIETVPLGTTPSVSPRGGGEGKRGTRWRY
jgi:gamma-glutamyltranspeptidase